MLSLIKGSSLNSHNCINDMDNTIGGEDVLFNYGRLTLAAPHSESNGTAGHLITESQRHRESNTQGHSDTGTQEHNGTAGNLITEPSFISTVR